MIIAQAIAFLGVVAVVLSGIYFFGIHIHTSQEEFSPRPLGDGGILVVAVAINDISKTLNQAVKRDNPELPPIELWDIGTSYKDSDNWITVTDDLIVIFLYSDVSSVLTKDELRAAILHEVGHAKLKHLSRVQFSQRILREEIDADLFAIKSGASVGDLISAIKKLSPDNYEKRARVGVLAHLE